MMALPTHPNSDSADQHLNTQKVLDHAPFLAAKVDGELRFRYVNPRYAEFHGLEREAILQMTVPQLWAKSMNLATEPVADYWQQALQGEQVTFVTPLLNGRNERRWMEISLVPHTDAADGGGFYCFKTDVTAAHLLQSRTVEDLKRRDEFLAILSHELRNPLSAISFSMEQLALSESFSDNTRKLLEIMLRQTDQLSRLLHDLSDVSRLSYQRIHYEKCVHDLHKSLEVVIHSVQPSISRKKQQLTVTLTDSPVMVEGDLVRLKQALTNLLENASKYTPEQGQIWLETRHLGATIEISIRDSGVGMAPKILERIFELFFQSEQPIDRNPGGLGVGLYLVDQIVRAHGGTVTAFSQGLGSGSRFVISLPALS